MKLSRRARGSTFILVLALLTILVFLMSVLTYTSRLESITSHNYAQLVQSRSAAASGLPLSLSLLANTTTITTPLQNWAQAPFITGGSAQGGNGSTARTASPSLFGSQAQASTAGPNAASAPTRARQRSGAGRNDDKETSAALRNGQAVVGIIDLSSRVNLNTITSPDALRRFLDAVYGKQTQSIQRSLNAADRANDLLAWRGESSETTRTVEGDLRVMPPEGTRRAESLYDFLKREPAKSSRRESAGSTKDEGREGLFTEEEIGILQNYATTFSQAPEVFASHDGNSLPRLSIHDLTAERLWAALSQAYPSHDRRLLMQYAANVMDYIDDDNQPTLVTDPERPEPWNVVIGLEQTPLITEVYPDAATPATFGDAGQYVEIHNMWSEPISVEGWRIVIGGARGGTGTTLNGTISPGGYLIITDNYDQPNERAAREEGSFLSIFGARKDDMARRVIVNSDFALPDENAFLTLVDNLGRVVDTFRYGDSGRKDSRDAYQRNDPRVRTASVAEATPFNRAPEGVYTGTIEMAAAARQTWLNGNKPLESVVDLFRISTAYAGQPAGAAPDAPVAAFPWQSPLYTLADGALQTNFDLTLLELFTTVYPPESLTSATEVASLAPELAAAAEEQESDERTTWPLLHSHGKLNLNTCDPVTLYALDATVEGQHLVTEAIVEQFTNLRRQRMGQGLPTVARPTEFVMLLVPRLATEEHAKAVAALLDQVTVNSSSFDVLAENTVDALSAGGQQAGPAPSKTRIRWRLALDEQPFSLIGYSVEP